MGQVRDGLWLAVAFGTELAALAALGHWGFRLDSGGVVRWVAGLGLPLIAAVLWGVLASPRAPVQVLVVTLLVKVLVFGSGVLALLDTGHPRLAVALAILALLGAVLSPSPASAAATPAGPAPLPGG